ncbi:TasA family protein [Nocardioides abyssi]|uniref:TasA family protein n=1 Tax=Nocardioides abyssi TaxID=3058370 RepID=A0ABT8EU31_9ACTN|nr:TasA family protein [Nocardioides abyssi]MDN4161612.1 TasA family protein [Nocardioides abyssi]
MKHAAHRAQRQPRRGRTAVAIASLLAGVLVLVGGQGTFAFWTDEASVGGATIQAGTIDLKVNGKDSHITTTLGMAAMVPGDSVAEVITLRNSGSAGLTYTLTGGLSGADALAFATPGALRLRIVENGVRSVSGSTATCSGGNEILSRVLQLSGASLLGGPRGPVAAGQEAATLCFEVSMATSLTAAPSSLQGKSTTLTLTFTASSALS